MLNRNEKDIKLIGLCSSGFVLGFFYLNFFFFVFTSHIRVCLFIAKIIFPNILAYFTSLLFIDLLFILQEKKRAREKDSPD